MSERLRFTTAQQVFEAFPRAAEIIEEKPGDESPLDFLRRLIVSAHRFDAITYAAYLLPRREAVWWGCHCMKALMGRSDEALAAAEAWVREPEDASRRAALASWETRERRSPTPWLALAAAQSGGNMAPEGAPPRLPPPGSTPVAVKAGLILAIAQKPARDQPGWTAACAEAAIRFAEGGIRALESKPIRPSAPAAQAP
jgi:hypothetical protein